MSKTNRRQWLQETSLGIGGTLLSPILARLNAEGEGQAPPRRVVFVVQSNGINPNHVTPAGMQNPVDRGRNQPSNDTLFERSLADLTLPEPIEALTPFKSRLTLIRGLSSRISEGGTGGHSTNHGAHGCYPGSRGPMDQTIDLALGEALPAVHRHIGLGLMNRLEHTFNYSISAAGPGRTVPI